MTDEQREYLDDVLDRAVPELGNWEPFDISLASARFWGEVSDDAAAGNEHAEALIDQIGRAGSRALIEREKRRAASGVLVRRRGDGKAERRHNQGFRATQRQAPDGHRYFQQAIWWEMGYEDVAALFQQIDRAWIGMGERRAGFRKVFDAYAAHPDAANAAAACRLAGFDPQEIEVTDADIRRLRSA